jgi:hypothetical protein
LLHPPPKRKFFEKREFVGENLKISENIIIGVKAAKVLW